jgi:threonine dehydrogenase-like Zn-dependent dehydrogenase
MQCDNRTMRAVAMFPAERAIRIIDHPLPRVEGPCDVLVQILDVGICGTDREIACFDYGRPPAESPYLIIGHEALGRVIGTGTATTRVKPGDLVVTRVRRPCSHPDCRACTFGRPDFCFTGDFTERGIAGRHGFMAEQIVDEERYLHVVPAQLRSVGVLVEPLTIAEKALLQMLDLQGRLPWTDASSAGRIGNGRRAVVLGAGAVGLLGCLALLVRGFDCFVYSREPAASAKAAWVDSVGARYVSAMDTDVGDLAKRVGQIDLFYEATGAAAFSFKAIEQLGTNGVFVFTGVPGRRAPVEINAARIMRRLVLDNQLLFGTVNAGPDAFSAAIDDLELFLHRWPGTLEALITTRHLPEAAIDLLTGPRSGIKPVIAFETI